MDWDNYEWGTDVCLKNPTSGLWGVRNYSRVMCQNDTHEHLVLPRIVINGRGGQSWILSKYHNNKKFCCSKHKTNKHTNRTKRAPKKPVDPISLFFSPAIKKSRCQYMGYRDHE